jgi:hypothetical protein
MALLFADGFDHYGHVLQKWDQASLAGTTEDPYPAIHPVGRFGSNGLRMNHRDRTVRKFLPHEAGYSTLTMGAAVRLPNSYVSVDVFSCLDKQTYQASLGVVNGRVRPMRGMALLGPPGDSIIPPGVWVYLEASFTFSQTTGSVVIHVDGNEELSATFLNTDLAQTGLADTVQLGYGDWTIGTLDFDDFYVRDDDTFMGDIRVRSLFPMAAGHYTDWTSAPTRNSNTANVSDILPETTDYNMSSVVGQTDTFAYTDIAPLAVVHAVQPLLYAGKDDAGLRQIVPVLRAEGTDYVGSIITLRGGGQYYIRTLDTNPADDGAWEPADVNAAEFGYRVAT